MPKRAHAKNTKGFHTISERQCEGSNHPNKMSLRMCVVTFEHSFELSEDEGNFKGFFAPMYAFLVDSVRLFFPNTTFESAIKLGDMDPVTMLFDGCLGRLQRNESDAMLQVVPFPVLGNGLMHGKTGVASKIVMWSMYNTTAVPSHTDVMDAFNSFSSQLWSLTILTAVILTVIVFKTFRSKLLCLPRSKRTKKHAIRLTRKQRTRRCMHQALVVATANILKQHSSYRFRGKLLCGKVILFLFAVFSFLIMFYFSSMIKTEMVVQQRPETISSYVELLAKPNIKPVWTKQLNTHWDFMNANKNTPAGRIWERAKRIGLDSCFLDKGGEVPQMNRQLGRQETVWFSPSYLIGLSVTNTCAFYRMEGLFLDVNSWYRSDENAPEKLDVIMQSALLHPDSVKKLNHIIQAEFEYHMKYEILRRMEFSFFPDTGSKSLSDCVANRIIYPDHEIRSVHWQHFIRLLVLTAYSLSCCLTVLSLEIMCSSVRRSTAKKNRETWTLVHGRSS